MRFSEFKEIRGNLATREHRETVARMSSPDPEETVLTMLRLALDGLPAEQRDAIRLAMRDHLTLSEIAGRLGGTRQEIQIALRDGLSTLRDVLRVVDPTTIVEPGTMDARSRQR
jgi:DNA-directed RNA polymerase specialized sigma24 family protein